MFLSLSRIKFTLFMFSILSICTACYNISEDLLAEDENLLLAGTNNAGTNNAGTNNAGTMIVIDRDMRMGYNPNGGCEVGSSLGVCTICGPDQTRTKPKNDEQCEKINCRSRDTYVLTTLEDGGKRCEYTPYVQEGDTCEALGKCVENPLTACQPQEPVELLVWYPGCGVLEGCEENNEPIISNEPEGTECYSFGTCNQVGQCSVDESCNGIEVVNGTEYCASDTNGCKVYTSATHYQNLAALNCRAYCFRANKECVDGWESNGSCQEGSNIGCNEDRRDLVCLCAPKD